MNRLSALYSCLIILAYCLHSEAFQQIYRSPTQRVVSFQKIAYQTHLYADPRRGNSQPPPKDTNLINEDINFPVVRLLVPKEGEVGEDEMVGVVTIEEALEEATKRELDLVLINDKSDPPVCKIIDYGKFKYLIEKRKKENMKKQVKVETKEIKMSASIEQHDFDVRFRATQKFLTDGDRVKVVVQFKGREMQHTQNGRELLLKLFQPLQDIATMDGDPKLEGRSMLMMLSPKKIST